MDKKLAELWHRVAIADHRHVFEQAPRCVRSRNEFDEVPQPGFVGSRYKQGGLLFVGKNPGNDPGRELSRPDKEQLNAIQQFQHTEEDVRGQGFLSLMETLGNSVMPQWTIVKKLVGPILDGLALSLDQVAYINLVKYHTHDTDLHSSLYDRSWPLTMQQISMLSPSVIIVLGKSAGDAFETRYKGAARRYIVPRTIGDKSIEPRVLSVAVELGRREKAYLLDLYDVINQTEYLCR
jgi:uracil-DNA glycosylase